MVAREYLGEKLKAVRKRCKISGQTIAEAVGVNQSTISRLEQGLIKPEIELVNRYLAALRLPIEESEDLRFLAESFLIEFDRWKCYEEGAIASLQKTAQKWEHSSKIVQTFSPQVIPGLFQTEEYMDHLFLALGEQNAKLRDKAVRARVARKKILKKNSKFSHSLFLSNHFR